MANGNDKNKFTKKEERHLRKTSKCKGAECPSPVRRPTKGVMPFKESPSGKSEPSARTKPKVRYERYFQKGEPVKREPEREEEKIIHKEEKYALFEKQKGAATKKDVEDIEKKQKEAKVEIKTVKVEPEKKGQYAEGEGAGFKASTQKFLKSAAPKRERTAYIKETEGYKKPSPTEPEYKFRSTREDLQTRKVAKYEKEGGGEIVTTDKEKRAKYLRSLSSKEKKRLYAKTPEKREKKFERKNVIKREKF